MLRKLYDRCVELARHKFSKPLLGFVAFIESFFSCPTRSNDRSNGCSQKRRLFKNISHSYRWICLRRIIWIHAWSFFLDASMVIIEFYGYEEKVFQIQDKMSTTGGFLAWLGIMFLAGFTPLPFKVFTITSGVIGFNLTVFFLYVCLQEVLDFY